MSSAFKALAKSLIAVVLLVNASGLRSQTPTSRDEQRLARFEKQADELRERLKIPGLSAVIVKDQKVLWAKGFGFADLENRVPATPETLYHVASLTKTFAAILVLQLVEQGKLGLDEPVSRYSDGFKDDSVKVKHLLSHTSDGTPGERYLYSGNRFDYLTAVIEKKTGKPFRKVMVETFLDPLAMESSVPGHDIADGADRWGLGERNLDRYRKSLSRFSRPYTLYGDSEMVLVPYPPRDVGAAAGLLSTVLDMAKYDAAVDRHRFLKKETQERAWTAFVSNSGQRLPHGLGWFVTDYRGTRLIWHYGHWGTGYSAIYLKVPERRLSLVMLANSEALADHQFQVEGGDITNNVFACNFLHTFVFEDAGDCGSSHTALTKWREHRRSQARTAIQVAPEILETYVGQYQFETLDNRIFTITRDGDRLFFNGPAGPKMELFAESESKFFLKIRPYLLVFTKAEGQLPQLKIVEGDETFHSKRIK
jgi:CubicO group peptidase (beta-lactamase class C family)